MSDELLSEFLFDSREHLSTAGAQLLELEKNPDSLSDLNALMGTMHTIKGNSGFLDLQNLYKLMHHAESLLQTVREKQCHCPQKVIDLLLQVLDTVEALLDRLESGDDDKVEWLDSLNQALSEAETSLESLKPAEPDTAAAATPAAAAAPAASEPAAAPKAAKAPAAPASSFAIKDDLRGKISLLALKDRQVSEEDELFQSRIEAMFAAGLRGLIVDLKSITSLSSRELKFLMALGRSKPGQTAFLLDSEAQQALYRVFQVLRLDSFMRFFPDKQAALNYIKAGH